MNKIVNLDRPSSVAQVSVLSAANLTKRYRERQVVKDISITLRSGEIIGLLGPNGAGKTTCFHMIVGLIPSDGGNIFIDQHNITLSTMDQRARMGLGYLPQEASVFRKLTAEENILAVLETRPGLDSVQRRERTNELLSEFHLETVRNTFGMDLSGGERRRTEIARALASEPRFILLDEPFAGVDPLSILEIQRIVKKLRQGGIGILITDHNVREALTICNRAYIVSDGGIIASGRPLEILENEQVREVYLGSEFTL